MRRVNAPFRVRIAPRRDKPALPVWTPQGPRRGDERSEESTADTRTKCEAAQLPFHLLTPNQRLGWHPVHCLGAR